MDKERLKISWTKTAVADYNNIINYLLENWSEKVTKNFEKIVQDKLQLLSGYSTMGISSLKIKGVRILLTKHNRLYYRIKRNTIEILNILDIRQDPKKIPY